MRSHIEFRLHSGACPDAARLLSELAQALAEMLTMRGWSCQPVVEEDWGMCIPIKGVSFPLWIGLGVYPEYPDGLLCFMEPSRPRVRRMLRSISTIETLEPLANDVEQAIATFQGAYALRWWSDEDVSGT